MIQIVVVGVIRKKGQYLLTKRISKNPKLNGKWQLPGGGLEYGETLEQCLHRELKEEVHVNIENIQRINRVCEVIRPRSKWHGVFIAYVGDLKGSEKDIKLDDEASEWRWFSPSEIKRKKSKSLLWTYEVIHEAEKLK